MTTERVVINLEDRARQVPREASPRGDAAPSEDAMALAFVQRYRAEYRYLAPWHRWIMWDGKRWVQDSTGSVFALIRKLVREAVSGTKDEHGTATEACLTGDAAGARLGTVAAA